VSDGSSGGVFSDVPGRLKNATEAAIDFIQFSERRDDGLSEVGKLRDKDVIQEVACDPVADGLPADGVLKLGNLVMHDG